MKKGDRMAQYNRSREAAQTDLFALLGIESPTDEQMAVAQRFIENVCRYVRSVTGH